MAKRVFTELVDDLNGEIADQTVNFGLDGDSYDIDLTADNAAAPRAALEKYVTVARPRSQRSTSPTSARKAKLPSDMRDWLRAHGEKPPVRGRIPVKLQELYHATH